VQSLAYSAVNYYANSGTGNYTNQYHFIEIPVRVQQRLGRRSPLFVNLGLSAGRLVASNALQYDAQKNVYYRDNSLFDKTQFTLSGGLGIRLYLKKAGTLEIVPRLQYGLTNLFRYDVYGARHLLFGGLELRWIFRKK
jgi:hypothetical protein